MEAKLKSMTIGVEHHKHKCTCNKTKERKAIPKLRIEILYCMDCEAIEFHTIKETTV